jgi:fused signal recognition particle receptor
MLGWLKKKTAKEESPAPENADAQRDFVDENSEHELSEDSDPAAVAEGEAQPACPDEPGSPADTAQSDEQATVPPEEVVPEKPASRETDQKSLFRRLQQKLSKTRSSLVYRLDTLFLGKKEIDQELFDDLEEILITADLGVMTTHELLDDVKREVSRKALKDPHVLKGMLQEKILSYLQESVHPSEMVMPDSGPFVIMVVGVNGVGKTTSIGKIGAKFVRAGKSVLLVAGDTFRAAAIDQLKIWGERIGVEVVSQKQGADPSSVVYDGIEYGKARGFDVIIIDTAGRLHTQVNLMEELRKIKRVIGRKLENAPHEVMLILDATTGQNGISQAKLFNETVEITGLTLTKLDGTAKGGIIVNVCRETGVPVRFIGIGEQVDDLRDFNAQEFVEALFGNNGGEIQEPEC